MAKSNGKPEIEPTPLDLEHELPPAEEDGFVEAESQPTEAPKAGAASSGDELTTLKAERDALLDRLARQQAEFENARKRASREQREFKEFAVADAVLSLLPALDSLDNATKVTADAGDLRAGVELIRKQLHDALARMGVSSVAAMGEIFDPHVHQAVETVETAAAPENQILEELQRGYKIKNRLLRPAMVRVARNPKSGA